MEYEIPEKLKLEGQVIEAEIRAAWNGVQRTGGVSWSEARVIDDYGTESERDAARALDRGKNWEELVDDSSWDPHMGGVEFSFLDPIGFLYYIAPAMIRCIRDRGGEFVGYALTINGRFGDRLDRVRLFSRTQNRVTARFVRHMIEVQKVREDWWHSGSEWDLAYECYWRQFDEPA